MIPLKDDNPTSSRPIVTYFLIGLCIFISVFFIKCIFNKEKMDSCFHLDPLWFSMVWQKKSSKLISSSFILLWARSLPLSIMAKESQMISTSERIWEFTMMVFPSFFNSLRRSFISFIRRGSSPEKGSSKMRIWGLPTSICAKPTLWSCPFERCFIFFEERACIPIFSRDFSICNGISFLFSIFYKKKYDKKQFLKRS